MQLTLQNFKLLHTHLISILSTNNYESEHLPQKLMQYIGMIVQSQKQPMNIDDFFDYFCENGGNKILKLTLEVQPLLYVKILSMLFINIRSQFWISYLLCQPFVINSIQFIDIPKDQEWSQYYISLLKSLSIRLNNEQLILFFNKKFSKFPLLYQALKYYNHSDSMVKTNVMNIILGIMKIKDQRVLKYFGRFPFTSYVLTYCCQVKDRIEKFNKQLEKVGGGIGGDVNEKFDQKSTKEIVKMYYIDIIDYICYLNDLIELGPEQLAFFVRNAVLIYIILPTLHFLDEGSQNYCVTSTTITDLQFKKTICLLLMGRYLPSAILQKLGKNVISHVYIPKVYSQQFLPNEYYWNRYNYQIESQCLKLFQDMINFSTEHEEQVEDSKLSTEFMEEINKISECLGFDILNYQKYGERVPVSELSYLLGFGKGKNQGVLGIKLDIKEGKIKLEDNPIRQNIMNILSTSPSDTRKDSIILSMVAMLNNITASQDISNDILKFCGLLMPCLDIEHYSEQYNLAQIGKMKQIVVSFLGIINKNRYGDGMEEKEKESSQVYDGFWFNIDTIKNMLILLEHSLYKRLEKKQEQVLIEFYRQSLLELKQIITKKNMKWIVQMFQFSYSKVGKQALVHSESLPQSVLIPRKSVKQVQSEQSVDENQETAFLSSLYFKTSKQKVKYFIDKFVLSQTFLFRYIDTYGMGKEENCDELKSVYMGKYNLLYTEKYCKIQEKWKVGENYQIGFTHIVECFSEQKRSKKTKKLIIVQDKCNLVIVEPSKEQNSAKIIVNHPWKYLQAEIDRQTGKKMSIKLSQCIKGNTRINLFFENESTCAGSLEWMNGLKLERYQSEQAFILAYVKECLKKR